MTILTLDQATKTGYAVSIDGKIVEYGVIEAKHADYDMKIHIIKQGVEAIVAKYAPALITIEDVQFQNNYEVYYKLSKLQGVLIEYCIQNEFLYEVIPPVKWKGKMLIKGKKREEQKANAILLANSHGYNISDEDIADAICMNLYANKCINVKGV